jgi:fructose-bisphosphate aldolase class II
MDTMRALCRQRLEEFATAGQAGKIRPFPLSSMAKRYAVGELTPKFAVRTRAAQ